MELPHKSLEEELRLKRKESASKLLRVSLKSKRGKRTRVALLLGEEEDTFESRSTSTQLCFNPYQFAQKAHGPNPIYLRPTQQLNVKRPIVQLTTSISAQVQWIHDPRPKETGAFDSHVHANTTRLALVRNIGSAFSASSARLRLFRSSTWLVSLGSWLGSLVYI